MRERIVVLDGAMGTMVQQYKLTEAGYRGDRLKDWRGKDLKGCLEILLLTKPDLIDEIHRRYLEAGADIIETNTFSGTTIGLHDFLFQGEPESGRKDAEFFQRVVDDRQYSDLVSEINLNAARVARHAADMVSNETGRRRFVGGSLGPLPVTASLSPDVNDPSFRAVTFDQIRKTYSEQAAALLEGGVDLAVRRNYFRHAECKSSDRCHHRIVRKIGQDSSADHFRNGDRSFGTNPERPDGRSVSHVDRPRGSARRGIELRARARRDGALHRRARAWHQPIRERVSERRPARSVVSDRFSRDARKPRPAARKMVPERLAEYCRRLLRDDPGSYPADR